jgi:hypothetical protein
MAEPILDKVCSVCKRRKSASRFYKDCNSGDGFTSQCKSCRAAYQRTPKGRANTAWQNLRKRIRAETPRLRCYQGVEVRLTKEEFVEWFLPRYTAWIGEHPGVRPSVDRIDSKGHYELSNLQLISVSQNAHKALRNLHLDLPAGVKRCGRCKEILPSDRFKPAKHGTFGLYGWCIECTQANEQARGRRRYSKRRDRLTGVPEGMNRCRHCQQIKARDEFTHGNCCRDCKKALDRAYHQKKKAEGQ